MSEYVREFSHLDPKYLNYLRECDTVCFKVFKVSIDDMADADWNFYFTEGYSPREAIQEAFEYYWCADMSDGMVDYFSHTLQQLNK
tara:strand:+ start:277 stop:534 length:258 start_codon:yes stop_codon:yes gene_type:complete